jgi:hypothetical protein
VCQSGDAGNSEMVGNRNVRKCVGNGASLLGTTRHKRGTLVGSEMLTPLVKPQWAHTC